MIRRLLQERKQHSTMLNELLLHKQANAMHENLYFAQNASEHGLSLTASKHILFTTPHSGINIWCTLTINHKFQQHLPFSVILPELYGTRWRVTKSVHMSTHAPTCPLPMAVGERFYLHFIIQNVKTSIHSM